ncbi:MAG: DNA repair protein RecO, partial [bacterium]|nr:DNA repair protein RecO [bacterium]
MDEGVVLARRNYGEADRILSLFCRKNGRQSFLAKGVRKPSSKKRGHIEVFSHIKFQASRSKGIDMITEVDTLENFKNIRLSLKRTSLAYYFMEAVGRSTREGEKHRELFDLINNYLQRLEKEKTLKKLKSDFIFSLLTTLGFWPRGKILQNPE